MTPYHALLKVIQEVVGDFKTPKEPENPDQYDVVLLDEYNDNPVLLKNNKFIIYTKTEEGAKIQEWVFKNAETLTNKDELVVPRDFAEMIGEASRYTKDSSEDEALLEFLNEKVPKRDLQIISDALFIRRIAAAKKPVQKFRELMNLQYSARGLNISNLISEGYYESYLIPFYNYLSQTEGDNAQKIFDEIYEEFVTLYPLAVFVSQHKSSEKVAQEIIGKIALNITNGQHVLNIHGIGRVNKETIENVIQQPEITKFFVSDPDIVNFDKKIYVRLHF